MTSCAMIAGMVPMALGLSEAGEQTAPLARAVIGGLAAATLATLIVLPTVFALVQGNSTQESASLDPDDPESLHYHEEETESGQPGASGNGEPLVPHHQGALGLPIPASSNSHPQETPRARPDRRFARPRRSVPHVQVLLT